MSVTLLKWAVIAFVLVGVLCAIPWVIAAVPVGFAVLVPLALLAPFVVARWRLWRLRTDSEVAR